MDKNLIKISLTILGVIVLTACNSGDKVIYDEKYLTSEHWIVEQQPQGEVAFDNRIMEITDANGCTVWFKYKLQSPVRIEYDVTVIDKGGPHDRVSDLNSFWMATDPGNRNDFFKESEKRDGKFKNYHTLKLYYVGYGGHNNTKTRFRRYNGNRDRPLLPEHDLSASKYLITPNKRIHITLLANGSKVGYYRNNKEVFSINDDNPYLEGYFGIRTVNNHMEIENLKISRIN